MDLRGELAQVNLSPSMETFALMTELYVLAGDVKVLLSIANFMLLLLPLCCPCTSTCFCLVWPSQQLGAPSQALSCHKDCRHSRCCCIILQAHVLLGSCG